MSFWKFYKDAYNTYRAQGINVKWRLFVSAILILFLVLGWAYAHKIPVEDALQNMVARSTTSSSPQDTLFEWYLTGIIVGMIVMTTLYEGEFLIGVWKALNEYKEMYVKKLQSQAKKVGKEVTKQTAKVASKVEEVAKTLVEE